MASGKIQERPVVSPGRFLFARWLVGLLAAVLIGLQGAWLEQIPTLLSAVALAAWLTLTTAALRLLGAQGQWLTRPTALWILAGDCLMSAVVVRAVGSMQSPTLLLLALPVLGGGFLQQWRPGLLLGLFASLLYGLIGLEGARRGMLPGALWSLIAFHTLLFASMGLMAGLLGRQMLSSLREAAATRSELETVRLTTDRVLHALTCGLIAVDAAGRIQSINPEARRLLGLPAGAADLSGGVAERNQGLLALLALAREDCRAREVELTLRGPAEQDFPAWIKVSPAFGDQGTLHGLVALFWDLTERKRQEDYARRRERLAMVGEMSAGLAHEIRNSLKPITGSIELLQKRTPIGPELQPLLDLITREAASLEAFLSQFLTLARDKTLKLVQIDLEDLIGKEAQALQVGRTRDPGDVAIHVSGNGALQLEGDPDWLRQAFRNVMLNALEADPAGRVEVRLERFERDGRPWIRTRVSDHGPGLAGIDPREVFDPFRTTKPHGSGLGLPIAQRGVEEHGGRIAFDTSWPEGGCVVIELPEQRVPPTAADHAA